MSWGADMTKSYKYKAFISYSHSDRAWAAKLLRSLEGYRLPKRLRRAGVDGKLGPAKIGMLFRDRDEFPAAEDLTAEVKRALTQSEFMIILCSPAAAASRWVNREIIEFKKLNGEGKILSVILSGEPFATDKSNPEEECFPPALRFKLAADGRLTTTPAEPLAADLRTGGDGFRRGLLKLVAGLLGIGLDALIERDLQRKMRRVTAVTAASLVAMLGMGALTYEAITARQEAEQARGEAEGLIEFMLTDLKDKLREVGRLDVLDAVGDRAVDYYGRQSIDEMPADSLGRRARAFHLLGEIEDKKGDLHAARSKFHQAYLTTEAQLKLDPADPNRVFEHSQSSFWLGYLSFRLDELREAERAFSVYRELAEDLVSFAPAKIEWKLELAYAHHNLGVLYSKQPESQSKALAAFFAVRDTYISILSTHPGLPSAKTALADAHAWIADLQLSRRAIHAAIENREIQLEILESMLTNSPMNRSIQNKALNAKKGLARLKLINGKTSLAIRMREEIARDAKVYAEYSPDNLQQKFNAATNMLLLADTYRLAGNSLDFENLFAAASSEAISAEKALREKSGLNIREKMLLRYRRLFLCAHFKFAAREFQSAIETVSLLKGEISEDRSRHPDNLRLTYLAAKASVLAGQLHMQLDQRFDAEQEWAKAIELLTPHQASLAPEALDQLFRAHFLLKNLEPAKQIAQVLQDQSYARPDFIALAHSLNAREAQRKKP